MALWKTQDTINGSKNCHVWPALQWLLWGQGEGVLPIMPHKGRVEKSVIWFWKRAKRCILCCEKVEETFWFCDFSSFKDSALGVRKGFINRRYKKRSTFCAKDGILKGTWLDVRVGPFSIKLCWAPLGPWGQWWVAFVEAWLLWRR